MTANARRDRHGLGPLLHGQQPTAGRLAVGVGAEAVDGVRRKDDELPRPQRRDGVVAHVDPHPLWIDSIAATV